ncbi:hypothetical protein ElyMa_002436500, partial [Elysia marginata]
MTTSAQRQATPRRRDNTDHQQSASARRMPGCQEWPPISQVASERCQDSNRDSSPEQQT